MNFGFKFTSDKDKLKLLEFLSLVGYYLCVEVEMISMFTWPHYEFERYWRVTREVIRGTVLLPPNFGMTHA